MKIKTLWCNRILKCYVFPVVSTGMEAWTLTETLSKTITASEMLGFRHMLRVSCTDNAQYNEVLR